MGYEFRRANHLLREAFLGWVIVLAIAVLTGCSSSYESANTEIPSSVRKDQGRATVPDEGKFLSEDVQKRLAATGSGYPTPKLFVERWNFIATARNPSVAISSFTSLGARNEMRPLPDLALYTNKFKDDHYIANRDDAVFLHLGKTGLSVDHFPTRLDPTNILNSGFELSRSFRIQFSDPEKQSFGELCLYLVLAADPSIALNEATGALKDMMHYVPPAHSNDERKKAWIHDLVLNAEFDDRSYCEVTPKNFKKGDATTPRASF